MRTFRLFRRRPPAEYLQHGHANPPDEPQLEGVVFTDGTVCVRWLSDFASHSIWPDFPTFEAVHGHPEYGSEVLWLWDEAGP